MALQIPLLDIPRQSLNVRLAGQEVKLTVWYQPYDNAWYASLESPPATPIVTSRRLVSGGSLLSGLAVEFAGDIACVPTSPDGGEPGRNAWSTTHRLIYLEA